MEQFDKSGFLIKTPAQHFADWESAAFGFGYGTGEPHTIGALRTFFENCEDEGGTVSYDYQKLEVALGPIVAWLMINALLRRGTSIIEYGSSPRFAWLMDHGKRLREFVLAHTVEQLCEMTCRDDNQTVCYPDACNCGPQGHAPGRKCPNPFWCERVPETA
jgi:hypothetical protein